MSERIKIKYAVCRYMPDQIKGEFVNVGVLLLVVDENRLLTKWVNSLVRTSHLAHKLEQGDFDHWKETLNNVAKLRMQPGLLGYLRKEFSTPFCFSDTGGGVTDNPETELEYLASQYLTELPKINPIKPVTHGGYCYCGHNISDHHGIYDCKEYGCNCKNYLPAIINEAAR